MRAAFAQHGYNLGLILRGIEGGLEFLRLDQDLAERQQRGKNLNQQRFHFHASGLQACSCLRA